MVTVLLGLVNAGLESVYGKRLRAAPAASPPWGARVCAGLSLVLGWRPLRLAASSPTLRVPAPPEDSAVEQRHEPLAVAGTCGHSSAARRHRCEPGPLH